MMPAEATLEDMADLKDLKPLAKKLNAQSDAFNKALETIQKSVNELGLGVEVWLENHPLSESDWEEIRDDTGTPTGAREFYRDELGYGRLGAGWALLVRTRRGVSSGSHPEDVDFYEAGGDAPTLPSYRALLGVSRSLRIAAVPLIPKLLDELKDAATAALQRIEQAKKLADSLE